MRAACSGPLLAADADHAPLAIDVGEPRAHGFTDAAVPPVGQHQNRPLLERWNGPKEAGDFRGAQDYRQRLRWPRATDVVHDFAAANDIPIKISQGRQHLLIVGPRDVLLFDEIDQEGADLFPAEPVWAATVVVRQAVHRADVGRDRVLRVVAQVHLFDHALPEGRHRGDSRQRVAGGVFSFQHVQNRTGVQAQYSLRPARAHPPGACAKTGPSVLVQNYGNRRRPAPRYGTSL